MVQNLESKSDDIFKDDNDKSSPPPKGARAAPPKSSNKKKKNMKKQKKKLQKGKKRQQTKAGSRPQSNSFLNPYRVPLLSKGWVINSPGIEKFNISYTLISDQAVPVVSLTVRQSYKDKCDNKDTLTWLEYLQYKDVLSKKKEKEVKKKEESDKKLDSYLYILKQRLQVLGLYRVIPLELDISKLKKALVCDKYKLASYMGTTMKKNSTRSSWYTVLTANRAKFNEFVSSLSGKIAL